MRHSRYVVQEVAAIVTPKGEGERGWRWKENVIFLSIWQSLIGEEGLS